jgi:hypothetical protein
MRPRAGGRIEARVGHAMQLARRLLRRTYQTSIRQASTSTANVRLNLSVNAASSLQVVGGPVARSSMLARGPRSREIAPARLAEGTRIVVISPNRFLRLEAPPLPGARPADGRPQLAAGAVGPAGSRGPQGVTGAAALPLVLRSAAPQPARTPQPLGDSTATEPVIDRPPSSLPQPVDAPDLDEIANQVIRRIERRALAQRERLARS